MMTRQADIAGRMMVALDYPDVHEAKKLVQQLEGIPCYMKVGMQLFYAAGPEWIKSLKSQGYKIFLDLKLHDIPNTVKGGASSITRLGVDMFNVHAAGGTAMMQAAMKGVEEARTEHSGLTNPTVIAVTHLTSTSQSVLSQEIGIDLPIAEAVLKYARSAKQAGLQGVVASPLEVEMIKQHCGADFITVTPGIRPIGAAVGDQSRVMTPKEAFLQGTDFIVIGRPITASPGPRKAIETI